jgi:hypothetical protein
LGSKLIDSSLSDLERKSDEKFQSARSPAPNSLKYLGLRRETSSRQSGKISLFFQLPFVFIIFAAAMLGLAGGRIRPDLFITITDSDADSADITEAEPWPSAWRTVRVVAVCLTLWSAPIVLAGFLRG